MARTGITKAQVRTVRDRLVAQGQHPSADAVRQGLGDIGSKSTIHRFLTELREEEGAPGIRHEDTAGALSALVEQLAGRLHADAEARLQALRLEHAQALRDKDRELATLRAKVASLGARVEQLEEDAVSATPPRRPAPGAGLDGFGSFDSMLLNSRAAGHAGSPFNAIRTAARSEAPALERGWPGRGAAN